MQEDSEDDYLIELFTLEPSHYKELGEIISKAFAVRRKEEGGTFRLDEEDVKYYFYSPTMVKDMFVRAIYKPTGKIVGFFSGANHRTFHVLGKKYRIMNPSPVAVLPEHQHHQLATKMVAKLVEVGLEKGLDAAIGFFSPNSPGYNAVKQACDEIGVFIKELTRAKRYAIRIFDIKRVSSVKKLKWYERLAFRILQRTKKVNNPSIREFKAEDAEQLYKLTLDFIERAQLAFIRDHDDFMWYVKQPNINCVIHEDKDGNIDGFILAWKFWLAGFDKYEPFGWMDVIHTHRLSFSEGVDLCRYFCLKAKECGWTGIHLPILPYFDSNQLKKTNFILYPKQELLNLYYIDDIPLPEDINTVYVDFR